LTKELTKRKGEMKVEGNSARGVKVKPCKLEVLSNNAT